MPKPKQSLLPQWADDVVTLYESHAANQFVLHGNINDRFLLPLGVQSELGSITDFLARVLLPKFDIILSYDLGTGIRVEKGGELFSTWPALKEKPQLPRHPLEAVETLSRFLRYSANLKRLGQRGMHVGIWIRAAELVAPASQGGYNYDLNSLALLIRDWATETIFTEFSMVTCLLVENLNDLHPIIRGNPRTAAIKLPIPSADDLTSAFQFLAPTYPIALTEFKADYTKLAAQLAGSSLNAAENLLKRKQYSNEPILPGDLVRLKKEIVERESNELVEFIESTRTLEDLYSQDKLKAWLREDLLLWKQGDIEAMPMGYLICGPVGTGKTYMVECLAGEAGVPVVKIKNFRDKWIGSTEGNLEMIFRLLQSLGRCFVFIDEADQALGKRDSGSNDSGLSGRIYSMFAKEMSNPNNRGRVIWVLASSRPDLIEVDLKRPGRIDVKIPIFPTTTPAESFGLIAALAKRRGLVLPDNTFQQVEASLPTLLTPGAAETLAVKIYRTVKTQNIDPVAALKDVLSDYQNPVPAEILQFQIDLAVQESTDIDFVPERFRPKSG